MPGLIIPNQRQLENCESAGWEYLGDGLFCRGDELGWFTKSGFNKE